VNQEQFETMMAELMAKLDDGPGSHVEVLAKLAQQHAEIAEITELVDGLNESVQMIRIIMKYMAFDLEATRRERDQLRMMLEDQN